MPLVFGHVVPSCSLPRLLQPCLHSPAAKPPGGAGWLHEIKHDGFRMLVRRDAAGVRLFTRNGHDWTGRFPLIARAALAGRGSSPARRRLILMQWHLRLLPSSDLVARQN